MTLLGGCGFHPLYTRDGNIESLAKIRINPISDRIGQILRNALIERLTPHGVPERPRYVLSVTLNLSTQNKNHRIDLIFLATYTLVEFNNTKLLFTSTARAVSTYYLQYGASFLVFAERAAQFKALYQIADAISEHTALYFAHVHAIALRQKK